MATKTIADYKADYAAAEARGDAAGMKAANDGANAIRSANGEATQSASVAISNMEKRSSSGGSSSSSSSSDIGTQMQNAFNNGNYQSVLDLADQRSAKIDADSSLEQYRNQYNGLIEASRLALQQQPKQYENSADGLAQRLADAQYNNKLAQLQKAYNNNMAQIQANETAQRNLASTQNQVSNRNLATFMANNGLSNSGTNAQAMLNSNGMLQNNMANIGINAMNARNQAVNALEQDSMSAYNDAQAMLYNYLLEQEKANQDYGRQLSYLDYQNQLSQQNKVPVTYNGQTYYVDPVTALNFNRSVANGSYSGGSGLSSVSSNPLSYLGDETNDNNSKDEVSEEKEEKGSDEVAKKGILTSSLDFLEQNSSALKNSKDYASYAKTALGLLTGVVPALASGLSAEAKKLINEYIYRDGQVKINGTWKREEDLTEQDLAWLGKYLNGEKNGSSRGF